MQNWSIAQAAGSVVAGTCDNSDYATIQEAVNNASPDTVIDICPGTYSESVNLSLMGSTTGAMGSIILQKKPGEVGDVRIQPLVGAGIYITPDGIFAGNVTIQSIFATTSDYGIELGNFNDYRTVDGNVVLSDVVLTENNLMAPIFTPPAPLRC
jgi:pectin methylesterase-like acyl-CoA thioesterase